MFPLSPSLVEKRALLLRQLAAILKVLLPLLVALLPVEVVHLTRLLLLTLPPTLVLLKVEPLLQVEDPQLVVRPESVAWVDLAALVALVVMVRPRAELVDSLVATADLAAMIRPQAASADFSVEVVLPAALAACSAAAQGVALQSKSRAWAASLAQALVRALLAATSLVHRLPRLPRLPLAARPRLTHRPALLVTRAVLRLVLRLA
jgi:hypothetical protein